MIVVPSAVTKARFCLRTRTPARASTFSGNQVYSEPVSTITLATRTAGCACVSSCNSQATVNAPMYGSIL